MKAKCYKWVIGQRTVFYNRGDGRGTTSISVSRFCLENRQKKPRQLAGLRYERGARKSLKPGLLQGQKTCCGLKQDGADVVQQLAQALGEACGSRAVDHTVIVGQRQWQHQLRLERFTVPYRLDSGLGNTQDRHFRRVDDWRE